jgi:uncharacterized protein HemY
MTDLDMFTVGLVLDGIRSALAEGDLPAAASLIKYLAVRDPGKAEVILAALDLAQAMGEAEATS